MPNFEQISRAIEGILGHEIKSTNSWKLTTNLFHSGAGELVGGGEESGKAKSAELRYTAAEVEAGRVSTQVSLITSNLVTQWECGKSHLLLHLDFERLVGTRSVELFPR